MVELAVICQVLLAQGTGKMVVPCQVAGSPMPSFAASHATGKQAGDCECTSFGGLVQWEFHPRKPCERSLARCKFPSARCIGGFRSEVRAESSKGVLCRGSFQACPLVRHRFRQKQTKKLSSSSLKCTASEETHAGQRESNRLVELPLFPLPLVLFPGAILPLHIFEFRYRILMHTLMETDLRFGVVYTDPTSKMATVGCVGEVIKHERLVDDRFFMICKGQERFRILNFVRTKPYLVAQVEWLEDRPTSNEQEDVEALANEVETYMREVIRLSNRINGKPDKEAPEDLRKKLFPTPFSFWVGSTFEGAPAEQQSLLELEDTVARLQREKETLRNTLSYLTAASAVKDVFPSSE